MKKFLRFLLSLTIAIIVGAVGGVMMYNKFNSEEIDVKQAADSMLVLKADTASQVTATDNTSTVVFPVVDTPREEIPAEIEGSAVFFTVEVNGVPMRFLLDTGCNNMTISSIEYLFLKHQKKIVTKNTKYSDVTLADGSKKDALVVQVDSIKIGKTKIENIECTVIDWNDSIPLALKDPTPLLIGGDIFIKMEKRLSIDYKNKKIILENT